MVQELAKQIGDKTLELGKATKCVKELQFQLDERAAAILAGVDYAGLGKNEKERELRLDATLRADAEWLRLHRECHAARQTLLMVQAKLDALKALRRGEEWFVYALQAGVTEAGAASSKIVPFPSTTPAIRNFGEGAPGYIPDEFIDPESIPF